MASNFANQTYDLCDNPNPSPLLKRKEEPRCQTESFHMNRISNLAPGQWLSRRISNIYANPPSPSLVQAGAAVAMNDKSTKCYKIAIVILAISLLTSSTMNALFALRIISLPALLGSKCLTDTDCNTEMTCADNSCVPTCSKPCGKNAWCQAKDHIGICRCLEGYIGNPYSGCGNVTLTSIQHKLFQLSLFHVPLISQVIARATKIVEMMKHVKKHFVKSLPWLYQDVQLTLTATLT